MSVQWEKNVVSRPVSGIAADGILDHMDGELSTGKIVAIAIGVSVVVIGFIVGCWFQCYRRRRILRRSYENAGYGQETPGFGRGATRRRINNAFGNLFRRKAEPKPKSESDSMDSIPDEKKIEEGRLAHADAMVARSDPVDRGSEDEKWNKDGKDSHDGNLPAKPEAIHHRRPESEKSVKVDPNPNSMLNV